ncbi:hypothetical protein B0A48_11813 [Cryoendolithus antarcticus]|uniref:Uncharacterized protein n=1 Tax=Cryoendolithus antarcticus TaxID=1507870 RepID=A0A1V8ST72_9PEZI|nr:hypothetical protein B0A48_11813 [Cryoendolithus antarcticus]
MPRLRTAKIDFSVKLTRSLMTRLARSPKSRPTKRIQITGTAAYLTTITWSKEYPGAYGFWTIDDQGWVYINELPTQDAQSNGSIGSFDDFSAVWSDPEDRKIIQAALNAEAECIMTQAKRLNKGLRPNL